MDKNDRLEKFQGPSVNLKNSARPLASSGRPLNGSVMSKAERQARFNASCDGMSSEEAAKKASLFGEINPSEFRILRMVG